MKQRLFVILTCSLVLLIGIFGLLFYSGSFTKKPSRKLPAAVATAVGRIGSLPNVAGATVPSLQPARPAPSTTASTVASTHPPFFAHYYLWWDDQHWRAKLGPSYPYSQSLTLPADLSNDGCAATNRYAQNQLLDVPVPSLGLYSQDDPAVLDQHIQDAASAGLSGFVVSWSGNGKPDQTPASGLFSRRLDGLAREVNQYNATHATKFYLMLGYQGLNNSRTTRPIDWVQNDLTYFMATYQHNPAFQIPYYQGKPLIMLLDSRKFSVGDVATIESVFGPQRQNVLFIGDEHGEGEWNRGVSQYFDGDGWYWSSQNPYTNSNAFSNITKLANILKAQQKLWFSPLNGGYNKSNFDVGGSCIPRRDGQTLKMVYQGNKASHPDGWMYISWNEFYENTYIEPSLRYGRSNLDVLKAIIMQ